MNTTKSDHSAVTGRWTKAQFLEQKGKAPICMLTAYNFPVARALETAGIPIILVGDTLGMVEMGFDSTRSVTMDHMLYHVGAVRRGAPNTHVVGDMPHQSDVDPETAVHNAQRLIDAGADSVKLEGPKYDVVRAIVEAGIDVVGHTGLTPQTAKSFRQVGGSTEDAGRVVDEAIGLADAGCFIVVVEHVPDALGARITERVPVPVVGIGAGSQCDGQVLVINDLLGLGTRWPPFSKQYAQLSELMLTAVRSYIDEVTSGQFP